MQKIPRNSISLKDNVADSPGLYEIFLIDGTKLKVGISENVRRRLLDHAKSYQSGLKLKSEFESFSLDEAAPFMIDSKKSILAKHLFFDREFAEKFNVDLKSQTGRREFLAKYCLVQVWPFNSKIDARRLEERKEKAGGYRYAKEIRTYTPIPEIAFRYTYEESRPEIYRFIDMCGDVGFRNHLAAYSAARILGMKPFSAGYRSLLLSAVSDGLREVKTDEELAEHLRKMLKS